jgi:hypothetical protein
LYHGNNSLKTLQRLLVLVPHRDSRLLLQSWSKALFSAGLDNAWPFPRAVPLAILSRPLSPKELKTTALALREETLAGENDGKIRTGKSAMAAFPENARGATSAFSKNAGSAFIYGPSIDLRFPETALPETALNKLSFRFSPLVLGVALVQGAETGTDGQAALHGTAAVQKAEAGSLPPPPELSFRAAALANMSYLTLPLGKGAHSFEWEIGALCWLPKVQKKTGNQKTRGKG